MAPRIRLYGFRHLRDEQAAADLDRQVLMITIESLRAGKVREPDKIESFVLGTCRMTVLEIRRGVSRRSGCWTSTTAARRRYFASRCGLDKLTECLGRLAESERSVVVMTFYRGADQRDGGGSLGLSNENVRVIRHRALGRLRKCMTGGFIMRDWA